MSELFVISLIGVAIGLGMVWVASRSRDERIEALEHENELLRHELNLDDNTR